MAPGITFKTDPKKTGHENTKRVLFLTILIKSPVVARADDAGR